jgi:hypothetical protein
VPVERDVDEAQAPERRALEAPDRERSVHAPVELGLEAREQSRPEVVGRRVEDDEHRQEQSQRDQQRHDPRQSPHNESKDLRHHQKKNPMLKCICQGDSPGCRLIGKPAKRLIGPIGVE